MARAKVLTGARAKVLINGNLVGLFSNCSWSLRQGKEALYVLGRYSPAEITPTDQAPVQITLTGYRVVNAGPYAVAKATLLKNLLTEDDFSVAILDRQTGELIFQADGCRVMGWSGGVAQRGVSDLRLDIIGLIGEDEYGIAQGGDSESADASNIDDGA
jgi:hypothetical protein